jgi:glycosyltransferase involved in cell wall biosynthesis
MTSKIKVLFANTPNLDLGDIDFSEYEIEIVEDLDLIEERLAAFHPHVIFSFGVLEEQKYLLNCSFNIRKKWVHLTDQVDSNIIFSFINGVFQSLIKYVSTEIEPLVSVITPTYNSKDLLYPYRSLLSQFYKNWEWIIYDDGSTDIKTLNMIDQFASNDFRIKVVKANHSGSIGEVKHNAFMTSSGKYLVELDHDDELTPWCLNKIVEAFSAFPDAGFAYTDCAEVIGAAHFNAVYGENYGFGYGSYRTEGFRGRYYQVTNSPSINSKTVRHIVSMPNHARCWTKEFYNSIDGHNKNLFVADDYDLCVRTFLNTRMIHIKTFGYIQYHHDSNAQILRNAQIQNLVGLIHQVYEGDIHQRFLDLGVDDFMWRDGMLDWNIENPEETPTANYIMD